MTKLILKIIIICYIQNALDMLITYLWMASQCQLTWLPNKRV